MLVFFAYTYLFENGSAYHNSGFPVQGQVWGTLSSMPGCAACRVPREHVPCVVLRYLFLLKKKTGRWSK